MEEYKVSTGILITKDLMDQKTVGEKEILYIPAWLALLSQTM
jgi:predicted AAA+ superfamily ATPase